MVKGPPTKFYILECGLFTKSNYDDLFKKYELTHDYNTRGTVHNFLSPPATHLTKLQRSALYQCIKIYNYICTYIKKLPFRQFKNKLRAHLLQVTLYKIENFFTIKM